MARVKASKQKLVSKPVAKPVVVEAPQMSVTQLSAMYAGFLLTNMAVVWTMSMLFPSLVVLGTNLINPTAGLFYSMLVLTSVLVGATPLIETVSSLMKFKVSNMHWMLGYFILNCVGIWMVSRFAEQLGMGISAWWVAVVLAFVTNLIQGVVVVQAVSTIKS